MTVGRLYRFVQLEYAWSLGPPDGRYLLRDHAGEDAHHVLVLASWPTTTQRRSRRWGREAEPQSVPAETGLSRATLVESTVVDDEQARAWLAGMEDEAGREAVSEGLFVINGAIRGYRAAAADSRVHEVTADQALAARVGYGEGVEVADGAWTEARDVDVKVETKGSRRKRAQSALRPQERFAALLSGRDAVLACEELALRARADLDAERPREAALQTHLAIEAALRELQAFAGMHRMPERIAKIEAHRGAVQAAADEALERGPSEETVAEVAAALADLETALRARAASAQY